MATITFTDPCKSFVEKFIVTVVLSFLYRPQKVIKKVIYYVVNVHQLYLLSRPFISLVKLVVSLSFESEFDKDRV